MWLFFFLLWSFLHWLDFQGIAYILIMVHLGRVAKRSLMFILLQHVGQNLSTSCVCYWTRLFFFFLNIASRWFTFCHALWVSDNSHCAPEQSYLTSARSSASSVWSRLHRASFCLWINRWTGRDLCVVLMISTFCSNVGLKTTTVLRSIWIGSNWTALVDKRYIICVVKCGIWLVSVVITKLLGSQKVIIVLLGHIF